MAPTDEMRRLLFITGCMVLGALWLGPLPGLAASSFSAHMLMHMSVVAIAAPLLTLGVAGGIYDPVMWRPSWFAAVPASFFELGVVWVWHTPALHHAARTSTLPLVAEQASFLIAGLVLWFAVYGGDSAARRTRAGAGVVALVLTSVHMTLLGALLTLATRALYSHSNPRFGLTALQDQHLGGAIMLLGGGVIYLLAGLQLMSALLQPRAVGPRHD